MKILDHIASFLLTTSAKIVSGTVSRWVDCDLTTKQRIYYANHSSHLDILVLWASLPPEVRAVTRPIAARDYWDNNMLKRYLAINVFNSIMIERPGHGNADKRAPLRDVENTIEQLEDKYSLLIFPEGTRGTGEKMAKFKSGIYHLTKRLPDVELVPVYMENLNRMLPKGKLIPVPLLGSVTFGPPQKLRAGESKEAFLDRLRTAIIELQDI